MEIVKKHINTNSKRKLILAESIPVNATKNQNKIGFEMEVVNG